MPKKKKTKPTPEQLETLQYYNGIGAARAEQLLQVFKTPALVEKASLSNLQTVLGEKMGENLFRQINGDAAPTDNKDYSKQARYDTKTGESIALDYAEGNGTIVEIMEKHGLSERIFYYWQEENLQFFQLIKNARDIRNGRKMNMALNGMQKLLEGVTVTEQQTEAVPETNPETGVTTNRIKKSIITQKHIPPSAAMIIFTLCNLSPEDWKHVSHIKHEGNQTLPPYDLSGFSDEELEQFEALVKKATKGK